MSKTSRLPNILIIISFLVDLLTPTLIWKGMLPSGIRWVSEGAIALMIAAIPLRMLVYNKIPVVFWLVLFMSLVGISTALFTGQGPAPTLWGWWLMMQFPLVGLFAYLQPNWPKSYPAVLIRFCLAVILFEVFVQIAQWRTGTEPGDQLGGTFGQNGTGNLVLFLLLVVCFTIGEFLQKGKWIPMVLALGLGLISSVLGEMKLYYITMILLVLLSMVLYLSQGKPVARLIPVVILVAIVMLVFVPVYDAVVPGANEIPLEGYFTNTALLDKYLNLKTKEVSGQNYYVDLGRNLAVVYGWDKISTTPLYLSVGYGLGARAESVSLGIQGNAIKEGDLGVTSGTSALVILQETGSLGIIILAGFILAVVIGLFINIKHHPRSNINGIRYGLILFTVLFPLWLWYDAAWSSRVAMLLYWSTLGYVTGVREAALPVTENNTLQTKEGPLPQSFIGVGGK